MVGVSATNSSDALWSGSNYGADTFLAAPGVAIKADAVGGGTTSITGTSASAAMVAGAAAVLKSNDPAATNDVVVGRLARNADAAGTADQTGNGRLNLARSVPDTSTVGVTPVGAPPVGDGGPLIGPYVVANKNLNSFDRKIYISQASLGEQKHMFEPNEIAARANGTKRVTAEA